jgi:hypothetical protein
MDDCEPTEQAYREHVVACLREAASSDIVLLYAQKDDAPHFGSIMEATSALVANQNAWVFLVSPHEWPFLRNHPRVRSFDTLADAVRAVCAMEVGEAAREQAMQHLRGNGGDLIAHDALLHRTIETGIAKI